MKLSFSARNKGLKFLKSISPELPAIFYKGDPTRLRQILVNLINNAIKFTKQGQISIEVNQTGVIDGKVLLKFEVSDTGMGIPEAALSRMFKAFSQGDSSMSRKFGGTGLSLSISKNLVKLLGGEIGVVSSEGKGSTFWFEVAMEIGEGKDTVSDVYPMLPVKNNRKKRRILLVEDNTVNQTIAVRMLQNCGYYVEVVANGHETLDALRSAPYDLIFMDCQMPEIDGYEATRLIRQSTSLESSRIPIIAMTANPMAGDREKCLHAGMTDYSR